MLYDVLKDDDVELPLEAGQEIGIVYVLAEEFYFAFGEFFFQEFFGEVYTLLHEVNTQAVATAVHEWHEYTAFGSAHFKYSGTGAKGFCFFNEREDIRQ